MLNSQEAGPAAIIDFTSMDFTDTCSMIAEIASDIIVDARRICITYQSECLIAMCSNLRFAA
jgi:hypothetical protein